MFNTSSHSSNPLATFIVVGTLLSHASIRELGPRRIVNRIGHDLLHLLRQALLQHLGHNAAARGVRDLARILVGACVVDGVGELVFDGGGDLFGGVRMDWRDG